MDGESTHVNEEETVGERLQAGVKKAGDKLSEWGVVSPRLMLAGGGLFMTLSNWGLLPAVRLWQSVQHDLELTSS